MQSSRSRSRLGVLVAPCVISLLGTVACATESHGVIEGDLTYSNPPAARPQPGAPADVTPPPRHERVQFTWQSSTGGISGRIQTSLPDGEVFQGKYHEITSTLADRSSSFCGGWGYGGGYWYGGWYGGPWAGPGWYWGGAWPYYGSCDGYITYYSGQVVAMLEGDRGTKMRCHFTLDQSDAGMNGGGWGECQVSNGDRITAMFDASDATIDSPS